jgi:hypothetical protein
MRLHELLETASAGAVSSGGIATVAQPLGGLQKRVISSGKNKYSNAAPDLRKKTHAKR